MSYDSKYREWVEKHTQGTEESSESNELYQVYRGVPILRVKVKDNPLQYRFVAPVVNNWTRDFDRIQKRIDKKLDKAPSSRVREKASGKKVDSQDSGDVSYFLKWQDCQVELMDMKRREASMMSKLEELQVKVDELSSAQVHLRKEAADLKSQLKASEALISDLNKKK